MMELLELIGAVHFKTEDYKLKAAVGVIAIVQKLTQASLYHYSLRHKKGESFFLFRHKKVLFFGRKKDKAFFGRLSCGSIFSSQRWGNRR